MIVAVHIACARASAGTGKRRLAGIVLELLVIPAEQIDRGPIGHRGRRRWSVSLEILGGVNRFPAEQWEDAFAAARSGEGGKVVMDWS